MAQFFLDSDDVQILREMVRSFVNESQNNSRRPTVIDEFSQAPETYVARIPTDGIPALETLSGGQDSPGVALCDVYTVRIGTDADFTPVVTPVADLKQRVYNLDTAIVTGDTWALITRDKFGFWFVFQSSGGESGFWAELIGKEWHDPPSYIVYSWRKVIDDPTGFPALDWDEGPTYGGPGSFPAYEVNNTSVPYVLDPQGVLTGTSDDINYTGTGTFPDDIYQGVTGTGTGTSDDEDGRYQFNVVWLRKGRGDYYLFQVQPRWELVKRTTSADGEGFFEGVIQDWDQETESWRDFETVYLIDASTPEV